MKHRFGDVIFLLASLISMFVLLILAVFALSVEINNSSSLINTLILTAFALIPSLVGYLVRYILTGETRLKFGLKNNTVSEWNLIPLGSQIVDYVFISLANELRVSDFSFRKMPTELRIAAAFAMRAAISEVRYSLLNQFGDDDTIIIDWQVRLLREKLLLLSDDAEALKVITLRLNDSADQFNGFGPSGSVAARLAIVALSEKKTLDDWLASYDGIFLANCRLFDVVK